VGDGREDAVPDDATAASGRPPRHATPTVRVLTVVLRILRMPFRALAIVRVLTIANGADSAPSPTIRFLTVVQG
jgi:hypothetical protein